MFTAQSRYGQDPHVVQRTKTWTDPLKWNMQAVGSGERAMVFTCSWSDWFHKDADQWRDEAWDVVRNCPRLTFQILTKRADRIATKLPSDWPLKNVWLGVSVSEPRGQWRIDALGKIPATVRFLSYEPALEDISHSPDIHKGNLDWVIFGGESGPGYRVNSDWPTWARRTRDRCKKEGIAFFFKQSPGPKPETGIELDGQIIREFPL